MWKAKFRSKSVWVMALLLAAVISVSAGWVFDTGEAAAFQPDGISILQDPHHEPPCPYGHDDACENGPRLVSPHAYLASDPHRPHIHTADGHDHSEHVADIARLNQRVMARIADSGNDAVAGDGEPGGSDDGVRHAITSDIIGLPWVRDGQTPAEALTVAWLGELQEYNPALVTFLVRMPFLQDHTPGDLQAIQTLTIISAGGSSFDPDPQYATALATHAGFADGGGVDNNEAKIIAVTSIPYLSGGDALINLLAHFGTVEEHSSGGLYGNQLTFAVVRVAAVKQNSELMRTAVSATRHAETVMGQSLPTDFVGILTANSSSFAGANNGIHIQVDDGFDGTYPDRRRQNTIAHEIGHYWWGAGRNNFHEDWISEGAASYIGAYSVKAQFGDNRLQEDYYPCAYYRTIEHLRADNPQYISSFGSLCNYSLGEKLFINLDRNMGHVAFANGFRNLHQRLSTYETDEIDQGLSLMRSFCSQCLASTSVFSGAGHTLARHYGEKVLTDASAPIGAIPRLGSSPGVSMRDQYSSNRQYGVAEISASSPDQRRWLRLDFSSAPFPPETVRVYVRQYYEERHPYYSQWQERTVYSSDSGAAWFNVYLGNPPRRAIGHHWVYVYNEAGQKVAEAEYQVVP